MELCCTRPQCQYSANFFADLDDPQRLKTVQQKGFWFGLVAVLIYSQSQRWIERIVLVIIAGVTLGVIALVPILTRWLSEVSYCDIGGCCRINSNHVDLNVSTYLWCCLSLPLIFKIDP